LSGIGSTIAFAQQSQRPFSIPDEIGLTYFGGAEGMGARDAVEGGAVRFSPDGGYFAVHTGRGRPDVNRVEESLRFYRTQDILAFVRHSDASQTPSFAWVVTFSDKEGSIINEWRWLADSSGVAFVEHTAGGNQRLMLADIRKKTLEPLTSAAETVGKFDIRDRQHYVYTAINPVAEEHKVRTEPQAAAMAGTGHSVFDLLSPGHSRFRSGRGYYLWAVVRGRRFEVMHDGAPLIPEDVMGGLYLAMSPDGSSLVTTLQIPKAPASWERLYPPPYASSPYRIRAEQPASHYVRIDLQTGVVQALTDAPTSNDGGWFSYISPDWSRDGRAILLPGTFLSSTVPSQPCIAVLDLSSKTNTCVEPLKRPTETGWEKGSQTIQNARFVGGDKRRVTLLISKPGESSYSTVEYELIADGTWEVAEQHKGMSSGGHGGLAVTVKQGLNDPPQLVAANRQTSRVIWNPNPQLKTMEFTKVHVETWKDREGRDWIAGLYLPTDYKAGQRYPLVIQTHGFNESEFTPSGVYSTAFAARALAAVGIAVLQVREPCAIAMTTEGPCALSGYEAVANKLISEGLADPEKIGIVGFSRTCFYVMETLSKNSLHFKAASITDGQMITYLQYMLTIGYVENSIPQQFDSVIGAPPFGAGLQEWLKRSPGFNLDKITAPLLVVAAGRPLSLLFMWEPYAALHYLRKPVDLILLNTNEHILTNPALRMASQGGTVDWFRFWLQDYEDPEPGKKEQYVRWRELRKMQTENDAKDKAAKEPAPVN